MQLLVLDDPETSRVKNTRTRERLTVLLMFHYIEGFGLPGAPLESVWVLCGLSR